MSFVQWKFYAGRRRYESFQTITRMTERGIVNRREINGIEVIGTDANQGSEESFHRFLCFRLLDSVGELRMNEAKTAVHFSVVELPNSELMD